MMRSPLLFACSLAPARVAGMALLAGCLLSAVTPAAAETIGLRIGPRGELSRADNAPVGLRFSLSHSDLSELTGTFDLSTPTTSPLLLGLPQNGRNNAVWADWFPFDSGLRTSAGLVWGDSRRNNLFDSGSDSGLHSRAFLGFGWTASASSSSSGPRWRLDADVGASFGTSRDCVPFANQCIAPGSPGLKPNSGGDGIRWNPFISIGASIQY